MPSEGGARGRVLVVEDSAELSRGIERLLEMHGYAVEVASNVAEAKRFALRAPFDLMLCDVMLPDGDGCQLMSDMAAMAVPFPGIAMSGHDQAVDVARSITAGFAEHLVKPTEPREILAAVKRVIGSHHVGPG